MNLRGRLLAELNRPWRKDPLPAVALQLAYSGPGAVVVTITEGRLAVDGRDGAASVVVDLDAGLTLTALAETLALHEGCTATVVPAMAAVRAVTLLDESQRPLTASPQDFVAWTSPTWRVLEVARQALVAAATRIDVALAQLNLLTAAGYFADLWGRYTSTRRRPPVHAPVTGSVVSVTAGSPLAVASSRLPWELAVGGPGPSTLFNGARLVLGDVSVVIAAYLPKGTSGLGSSDFPRLVLVGPWPGATQFTADYTIVWDAEPDDAYTQRQLRELLRPRENNIALAVAITEDTGVPVREVRDLRRQVFTLNGPLRGRPLPGTRCNTATAEVVLEGEPTVAVIASAQAHAAAGVHVLVLGAMTPPMGASTLDVVVRAIVIGDVPPMQIGVTPIGGGRIAP